jgi:DNA-binding transcriptional ArsR family regulator
MQAAQLTVWKSPPQMRDVHDLDPGHMAEAQLDDLLELSRALANPTPTQIQEKAGVSQSTASRFVPVLQRAELVERTRIGQWTYYRRNEARIAALPELPGTRL